MFSAKPSWQGQVTIRLDDDHNVLDYVACLSEKMTYVSVRKDE
jgi:hypothetical protein